MDLTAVLRLEVETDPAGPVNLIENPPTPEDLGAWGWVTPVVGSIIRRVVAGGIVSLRYNGVANVANVWYSESYSVAAGQYVKAGWSMSQASNGVAAAYYRVKIEYLNAVGAVVGSSAQTGYLLGNTPNQTIAANVAPAGTVKARLRFDLYNNNAGANITGAGFATFYGVTLAAAATAAALASIAERTYQDIIGPTANLHIVRDALDVGILAATIKDASLDPAAATLLRPGRRARLTALNATTGLFEVLFAGKLDKAHVVYDLKKPADKQATITLAAIDATQTVANTNRPEGVATIADLPFVLEGCRVPWNVNGSGNQVPTATVASVNENASALDQVILARDTDLGYAWITKEGVLTAYSDRSLDYYGTGAAAIDEAVYSALDVSFDTEDCINEVLINYIRFAPSGETEQVAFGPYRDEASIEEWGVRQATFTIHGIAEASVPAYAASILAANATPAMRVNSVSLPIRTPADITSAKALIDLYAKAHVTNGERGLDQVLRVTGLSHDITPRGWKTTLEFGGVDSVAVPVSTSGVATGEGETPVRAYRTAAGSVAMGALAANVGTSIAITFPVDRFTVVPIPQVTPSNNGYTSGSAAAITTSGMTVRAFNPSASNQTAGVIYWQATQMKSAAAAG